VDYTSPLFGCHPTTLSLQLDHSQDRIATDTSSSPIFNIHTTTQTIPISQIDEMYSSDSLWRSVMPDTDAGGTEKTNRMTELQMLRERQVQIQQQIKHMYVASSNLQTTC